MIKNIYKNIIILINLIIITLILTGCESKDLESVTSIKLNPGAFVSEKNDTETFNLISQDSYKKVDTDNKIINNFNKQSNTYTFYKDNSFYVNYNSKDIKIDHKNVGDFKISPDGKYLFYFINDEFLVPVVLDLEANKEIYISNKAVISGEYIDWITKDKLAFYGIDIENKNSGIFIYDIKSGDENKVYDVVNGYVKFLRHIDQGIAIVEQSFNDDSLLSLIDIKGNITELSKEIADISDIKIIGEKIFVLGRVRNNNFSIYEITSTSANRLIFDFPNKININKGLALSENGEILFIGSNDNKSENIYKYSEGSVSIVYENTGDCNFIYIN